MKLTIIFSFFLLGLFKIEMQNLDIYRFSNLGVWRNLLTDMSDQAQAFDPPILVHHLQKNPN